MQGVFDRGFTTVVSRGSVTLEPLSCPAGGSVYRARPCQGSLVFTGHSSDLDSVTGGLNPVVSRGYYEDLLLYRGLSVRFLFVEELTLPVSP